jgi:hypothetical protein
MSSKYLLICFLSYFQIETWFVVAMTVVSDQGLKKIKVDFRKYDDLWEITFEQTYDSLNFDTSTAYNIKIAERFKGVINSFEISTGVVDKDLDTSTASGTNILIFKSF